MASFRTLFPYLFIVFFLFSFSESREFLVGGRENSWKIPSSPDDYNKWAEETRFRIGDSLVLKYDGKSDSVLQVTEENYNSCNNANPIKEYHDGETNIELDHSGPFFFISGAEGHCEKGQKLEVKVLSAKHGHSPAPWPSQVGIAPAPAPASQSHGLKVGILSVVIVLGSLVASALA